MSWQNRETLIPDIEQELEKAHQQNNRRRVKLLLNNLWWRAKDNLKALSDDSRRSLCDLFEKYGDSSRFKQISEKIWLSGGSDAEQLGTPDSSARIDNGMSEPKAESNNRMIQLEGGTILVERD
jgi:hypothetical protein